MAVVCKLERWRGQLAASLPSPCSWASAPLPQNGARAARGSPVGSALRALSSVRARRALPPAAARQAELPGWGQADSACVCLPVPAGLSAQGSHRGSQHRRHLRCFLEQGRGAEQSKANRSDLSFAFVRKTAALSP